MHDQRVGVHPWQRLDHLKRIRDIRQLLDQEGHTIQPGPHRLTSLDDLHRLATAEGIAIQPEIKTAW